MPRPFDRKRVAGECSIDIPSESLWLSVVVHPLKTLNWVHAKDVEF